MSVERAVPGHSDTDYTDCECQEELDHDLFKCNCGCHRAGRSGSGTPDHWKPGDRVIVRLPDKRRGSGIRGGGSRDVDVHGTVREVDLPGQPPGVKVDLDREIISWHADEADARACERRIPWCSPPSRSRAL